MSKADTQQIDEMLLHKFNYCTYRARNNFYREEIDLKHKQVRVPKNFFTFEELRIDIYKTAMHQIFKLIFEKKKVDYNLIKANIIIIIEKKIEKIDSQSKMLGIKTKEFLFLKDEIYNNIEKLVDLIIDSDLNNSIKNNFLSKSNCYTLYENRIRSVYDIISTIPNLNLEKMKQTYVVFDILSLKKTGSNLCDLVVTTTLETDDYMKSKNFWLSLMKTSVESLENDSKVKEYFIDGWFLIENIIVYNPIKMTRTVYNVNNNYSNYFALFELFKLITVFQTNNVSKQMFYGKCEYCECRQLCNRFTAEKILLRRRKKSNLSKKMI